MSHRAVVWALTLVLVASALFAIAPSIAAKGTHSGAPAPHVGPLNLATYAGSYGGLRLTNTFYPGGSGGENTLYFYLQDPFTGDHQVNVTLTDANASRDGVGSPVVHWVVTPNATTGIYWSNTSGVSYTFPSSILVGGWGWNLTAQAPLAGTQTANLFLSTFYTNLNSQPNGGSNLVLPGEPISLLWSVWSVVNDAPFSSASTVQLNGYYYTPNGTYWNLFPGGTVSLTPAASGIYNFKIPANATPGLFGYAQVYLWVTTASGGHTAENESSSTYWYIGNAAVHIVGIEGPGSSPCPIGFFGSARAGSPVNVCAQAGASLLKSFTPIANLPVSIKFLAGSTPVTPGGSPPTQLTTNQFGEIGFSFLANVPPLTLATVSPWANYINLTVTVAGATSALGHWTNWTQMPFYVSAPAQSGVVGVSLDHVDYLPGQTVTASWSVSSTGGATGTVKAVDWSAWDYNTGNILNESSITSSASTGSFSFKLPTGYTGEFEVEVDAVNNTTSWYGYAYGLVVTPQILLNPNNLYYTPGAQISVGVSDLWAPSGGVLSFATYATMYDTAGHSTGTGLVTTGTVANNSAISWNVPSTATPGRYSVYVWLGSPTTGTVASSSVTLYAATGYQVIVGVNTPSKYADGSYQPGQTITVTYTLHSLTGAPLPAYYQYETFLGGNQVAGLQSGTGSSGSFQLTLPSSLEGGAVFIEVEVLGTLLFGYDCGGYYCYGEIAVAVNPSPSFLSMEVPAGSGLTVGWLILLVIIIVVAVVLMLLIRRKKMPPTSTGSAVSEPMSPAAPAPSGPGATEWKEPTPAGGDGPPPMPSPPGGAT